MSRFSKLFGQSEDARSSSNPGDRAGNETGNSGIPQGTKDQGFGLQFVLESGETRTVSTLPVSLGRSDQNGIVLKDDTVSATHARVYYDEQVGYVCIVDVDSLNGLFINGQPTRKNVLSDGCHIRLGMVNLTFRDTGYIHPG